MRSRVVEIVTSSQQPRVTSSRWDGTRRSEQREVCVWVGVQGDGGGRTHPDERHCVWALYAHHRPPLTGGLARRRGGQHSGYGVRHATRPERHVHHAHRPGAHRRPQCWVALAQVPKRHLLSLRHLPPRPHTPSVQQGALQRRHASSCVGWGRGGRLWLWLRRGEVRTRSVTPSSSMRRTHASLASRHAFHCRALVDTVSLSRDVQASERR